MIITQTPLRISFLGGGTDFPGFFKKNGGCVITTTIDKYVYCIVKERFDDKIYVNWSKKEIVNSVSEIKHELVREAMRKVGVKKGVEISFLSDIPSSGSGLGSSSSVTVGVLNALYHYVGHTPPAQQLASEACEIEIDILKKPIGFQDQYIAAFGGLRFIEFRKRGGVKVEKVDIGETVVEDLDNQLMLFFTGKTRSAAGILTEQKSNIKKKTLVLNKMAHQARRVCHFLENGRVSKLGEVMNEGWKLKKSLASQISNSELDDLYIKAKEAGAIGGKIPGAGGGGFLLLVVPDTKRQAIRRALRGLKEMPFRLEIDGSKVIFDIRRY
ncbi:GHMP kinase [Candidatus Woesebacteria bacterium]|nr:GHMP kinase [Candidatus Woesebacteria bacterium]